MTPQFAQALAFLGFSFLIIVSGISMLTAERVIHSAVFLLVAMLAVSGIFTILEAEFLAAMQVMVYAGAVMVLVLFTIMLTGVKAPTAERRRELSTGAGLVALIFGGLVYSVLAGRPLAHGAQVTKVSTVAHFGQALFKDYVLPFELASMVLLIALVGAIFIAMEADS